MIYRTQKADFDLQLTSVIYIRCKADVIDDTERLFILRILRISPYSVRMRENKDQNNYEYGHFLRSNFKSKS